MTATVIWVLVSFLYFLSRGGDVGGNQLVTFLVVLLIAVVVDKEFLPVRPPK